MKKTRNIISLVLALAMMASMSVAALADSQSASENTATTIPVYISAEATTFDVTVPTSFPTTVDPDTGESVTATDATIVNNSSGSISVSQIKVTNYGGWTLASFDADLRNADVDSNQIGVSVKPTGGRNAAASGTILKTTDSSTTEQVLLTSSGATADEWIIDAKNTGSTDELTISYGTNATPVSAAITNQQVASIVVTVSWNK